MTVIRVPKTPASAMNPNRRISSLLRNQIEHLQEAEFRLPANRQSNIYINELKTEGQAAEYIRIVTAQLHPEASARKLKRKSSGKARTFTIAAAGQSARKTKAKTRSASNTRSKSSKKTKKKR
jgi:hypothetical protein